MTLINKIKTTLFVSTTILFVLISQQVIGQKKDSSSCITQKELVGIWQEKSGIVGSGLNQNFQFFANGTFILNVGNDDDDARDLIMLKGKYRLYKCSLYFTITSRKIVEGKIGIADAGISSCIFSIENGKVKEVQEPNIKEIPDPCYITVLTSKKIKLNNETYYKVK